LVCLMEDNLFIFNFNSIMKKHSLTIIKIFAFIFLLVITDQVVGLILRKLYFQEKIGQNYALNYGLINCKAEILIFGSSRAVYHYDSRIISDRLHMSCYNAGMNGGHSIILPDAQIKVITNRYLPRVIILEFDPTNIVHYPKDYDRLSILLPYYKNFPEVRSFILLRSPYERLKLLSAIYPFNSNIFTIIRMNLNLRTENIQDYGGYIPLGEGVMNIGMVKTEPEIDTQSSSDTKIAIQPDIDTNMINSLKDFISICKEKRITLYIINSPVFHAVNEKKIYTSSDAKLALEIIHREGVKYFDYSFDSKFAGHLEWFKDKVHLNNDGAKIFTNLVVDRIINEK
jgi:hypothetical protein